VDFNAGKIQRTFGAISAKQMGEGIVPIQKYFIFAINCLMRRNFFMVEESITEPK